MTKAPTPQEVWKNLSEYQLYKDWKRQNKHCFLSHFFCTITGDFKAKTSWEVGFYDPVQEKITVFSLLPSKEFQIKPADDIFKREEDTVELLDISIVTHSVDEALETFKTKMPEYFPKEILGDGFVSLQTLKQHTVWNCCFVTRSLKFVSLKIDAASGKPVSHDVMELMDKK
ncbi:MAG: hypothetical protein AABX37_05635 [Nanoarchaeota archaeon]